MTIKQLGGVFGRSPEFSEVVVTNAVSVDTVSERTSAAGVTVDGAKLKDGHFVPASTKGVDFSAASGTGTNKVLSNYEEGTWTPVLTAATPGDLSVSYSTQTGEYTRIGREVFFFCKITTSVFTHTTASGIARITGLPFTVGQFRLGSFVFERITKAGFTQFTPRPIVGQTYIEIYASTSAGTASTVKITEMPTGGSVAWEISGSYRI